MKTIILGMLFALSCNYCFAQLKIENSTPKPEKKDVYDVYMSYDGTVLTTLLHRDPSEVPDGKYELLLHSGKGGAVGLMIL